MSCPHGAWPDEDCEACIAADQLWVREIVQQRNILLKALIHMRKVFIDTEGSFGDYENNALDEADAAIAKATGEQV